MIHDFRSSVGTGGSHCLLILLQFTLAGINIKRPQRSEFVRQLELERQKYKRNNNSRGCSGKSAFPSAGLFWKSALDARAHQWGADPGAVLNDHGQDAMMAQIDDLARVPTGDPIDFQQSRVTENIYFFIGLF